MPYIFSLLLILGYSCHVTFILNNVLFPAARKKKQKSWIKKYFLQATAYSLMYEEMTGDKVDQIVILISADDDTVMAYVEDKNDYIEQLKMVLK